MNIKDHGFQTRPVAERKAIASKGGKVRSTKKKLARRLDWFRRIGIYSDEQIKSKSLLKAALMLEDPSLAETDLLDFANQIRDEAVSLPVEDKTKVLNSLNNTFKSVFGERIKSTNLNINASEEVADKLIGKMFGSNKNSEEED